MSSTAPTAARVTVTCGCATCGTRAIDVPACSDLTGTTKQAANLRHTYVAAAYAADPISRLLVTRAGVTRAEAR